MALRLSTFSQEDVRSNVSIPSLTANLIGNTFFFPVIPRTFAYTLPANSPIWLDSAVVDVRVWGDNATYPDPPLYTDVQLSVWQSHSVQGDLHTIVPDQLYDSTSSLYSRSRWWITSRTPNPAFRLLHTETQHFPTSFSTAFYSFEVPLKTVMTSSMWPYTLDDYTISQSCPFFTLTFVRPNSPYGETLLGEFTFVRSIRYSSLL